MPCDCRSAPVMAVRLIGVFCTVESRFSAVTTTSCRSVAGCARFVLSASLGSAAQEGTLVSAQEPANAAVSAMRRRNPRAGDLFDFLVIFAPQLLLSKSS